MPALPSSLISSVSAAPAVTVPEPLLAARRAGGSAGSARLRGPAPVDRGGDRRNRHHVRDSAHPLALLGITRRLCQSPGPEPYFHDGRGQGEEGVNIERSLGVFVGAALRHGQSECVRTPLISHGTRTSRWAIAARWAGSAASALLHAPAALRPGAATVAVRSMAGRARALRGWTAAATAAVVLSAGLVVVSDSGAVATQGPAASSQPPGLLSSAPVNQPIAQAPAAAFGAGDIARKPSAGARELVQRRTATSAVFENANGSLTVRSYAEPHFYRPSGSSAWQEIDSDLAPISARPGWSRSKGNSWSASFGPAGATGGGVQITNAGRQFGFAAREVADPGKEPSVSGNRATYRGIWPGVDVEETVTAAGVKEDIVLHGPSTRSRFAFDVVGATPRLNRSGSVDLMAGGVGVGTVPALTVTRADGATTSASGLRLSVEGRAIVASISPTWLRSLPQSAFPVVIDPVWKPPSTLPTHTVSRSSDGQTLNGVMQVGLDSRAARWRTAFYVPMPAAPAATPGQPAWQLAGAHVYFWCDPSPLASGQYDFNVYGLNNAENFPPTYVGMPYGVLMHRWQWNACEAEAMDGQVIPFMAGRQGAWFSVTSADNHFASVTDPNDVFLSVTYVRQPAPSSITAPTNHAVISTATPTLTATPAAVDASDRHAAQYDFQIGTNSDGTGVVVDSGWIDQPTWTVPPGALSDGLTYYATVRSDVTAMQWWDHSDPQYVPPAAPRAPISFQVKKRLGAGGPSPTDTVGAPPGSSSMPSQGAPSPGDSPSSETVNMLTGNLAVAVGTQTVQALGGPVGLTLTYNSVNGSLTDGSNFGLLGQYYQDTGNHAFPGAAAGQRVDPGINLSWNSDPPIGGLTSSKPFLVRWTGALRLPAGTWTLGGLGSGGMRVYLDGSSTPVYDNWSATASTNTATFGTTTVAGASQHQIKVEAWANAAGGAIQLWANHTSESDPAKKAVQVPVGWLTPQRSGLPPGWSLTSTATVVWTHAEDQGQQVVLSSPSGAIARFTRTPQYPPPSTGMVYQPPAGSYTSPPGNDDNLTLNASGQLQLATAAGLLYTFTTDGSLASVTSVADDRHPTALRYTYGGSPIALRTITDPVSNRSATAFYGGDANCPTSNPAPTGYLCRFDTWDGQSSTFGYNGDGELASVSSPGGRITLLGYDSSARLAQIRDALANAYVSSGGSAGSTLACPAGTTGLTTAAVDTQICYDQSGRVAKVTQPAPTTGAARPYRNYTYGSGHTDVSIGGFAPSSGYAARTSYDGQGRITSQTDSAGKSTTTVWDTLDRPIATGNAQGLQTSTLYDPRGNVTDVYGPAPLACFSGGWPTDVTPVAPIQGYLPVADPHGTAGCGITTIPHTHSGHDEGLTGLAATYWSNGQFTGPAVKHATGVGGTATSSYCPATTGLLCANWPAGTSPVAPDAAGKWSMKLTGSIDIPDGCGWYVQVDYRGPITLWIDGRPLVRGGPGVIPGVPDTFVAGNHYTASSDPQGEYYAGECFAGTTHQIELDYQGSAAVVDEFAVSLVSTQIQPLTWRIPADSTLHPNYGLTTSTTDPDGKVTATTYTAGGNDPVYGLATTTTAGAGSATPLTTTNTYEPPTGATFFRRTSTTLPAGNTTSYTYYGGTDGPIAAACGVSGTTLQGGQLKQQTDPAPDAGTPARVQQFVYDATGRQVGRRIGPVTTIGSALWQCTSYDARGRVTTQTWPATGTAPARTVTHTYAVGGNPLVSSVSDASGTITSTADLLGRLSQYVDTVGKVTQISYNQAGQVTTTSGPQGTVTPTYNPDTAQVSTVSVDGTLAATASYDAATERLTGVTYANGTTAALGYDALGHGNSLVFTRTAGGSLIAGNQVVYSPGGRIVSEQQNLAGTTLTNPNPAGATAIDYTYDPAGRLIDAWHAAGHSTYSYADNDTGDGCASPKAGANTNRTAVTLVPAAGGSSSTTRSCYNAADQLVATITGTTRNTDYAYDGHGNQTRDSGAVLTWDASDRLASTTKNGATIAYTYDALDRVLSTTTGGTTVYYAYAGFGDAPAAVLNSAKTITDGYIGLPGQVLLAKKSSGSTWSYPDLHGHHTAVADATGTRQGNPVTYDPWGQQTSASGITNASGSQQIGAFGTAGKLTNPATGITIMGARPYNPAEARFLSVDPVEGGCANNYAYVFGDPLSQADLTGKMASCADFHVSLPWGDLNGGIHDGTFAFEYKQAPRGEQRSGRRCNPIVPDFCEVAAANEGVRWNATKNGGTSLSGGRKYEVNSNGNAGGTLKLIPGSGAPIKTIELTLDFMLFDMAAQGWTTVRYDFTCAMP
ncbi:RHS repeat-associated core domain-containing protein [Micromonospora sp. NPDC093277]|uniref:RHS repeat-associated core domain-containing protein n=1 Tax=Micromonospora sp. NPDC093277 TaxID=3364291 RepID=UPI00382FF6A4